MLNCINNTALSFVSFTYTHKHHTHLPPMNTLPSCFFKRFVSFSHCCLVTLHRAHTCPLKHTNMWSHTLTHHLRAVLLLSFCLLLGCGYESFFCPTQLSFVLSFRIKSHTQKKKTERIAAEKSGFLACFSWSQWEKHLSHHCGNYTFTVQGQELANLPFWQVWHNLHQSKETLNYLCMLLPWVKKRYHARHNAYSPSQQWHANLQTSKALCTSCLDRTSRGSRQTRHLYRDINYQPLSHYRHKAEGRPASGDMF